MPHPKVAYLAGMILMLSGMVSHSAPQPVEAPREQKPIRILALGDSLTEGYGVPLSQAYPALLQERLRAKFPKLQ